MIYLCPCSLALVYSQVFQHAGSQIDRITNLRTISNADNIYTVALDTATPYIVSACTFTATLHILLTHTVAIR